MTDNERVAVLAATIMFGVGIFFSAHWDTALALSGLWILGLVVFFGGGDG